MKIKKVGIVCCSNGQKNNYKDRIQQLRNILSNMGIESVLSKCIYEKEDVYSGTARDRASELMELYKDESIDEIFDISGGDIANGVLEFIDYSIVFKANKKFWGYSDLTTIINAIYTKTGKESVLYQIKNLLYDNREQQIRDFKNTLCVGNDDLFNFKYEFLQQESMEGVLIGGNIRCFLKLAGTEYMPEFRDKILLLESCGGTVARIETYMWQLKQLGAFDKVNGILLGTFTQMEKEKCIPTVYTILKRIVGDKLPIAMTKEIGHGTDSKAIVIGKEYNLKV